MVGLCKGVKMKENASYKVPRGAIGLSAVCDCGIILTYYF